MHDTRLPVSCGYFEGVCVLLNPDYKAGNETYAYPSYEDANVLTVGNTKYNVRRLRTVYH